jgi:hypothetical protein
MSNEKQPGSEDRPGQQGGNFANDRQRASEAGKKGGQSSRTGSGQADQSGSGRSQQGGSQNNEVDESDSNAE